MKLEITYDMKDLLIDCEVEPIVPAVTNRLPEDCHMAEGGEIEFESIQEEVYNPVTDKRELADIGDVDYEFLIADEEFLEKVYEARVSFASSFMTG